jgi:hypothetical protein
MKLQSKVRKSLVIAGAAVAMMFVVDSVQARQTNNSQPNDGSQVAALAQPVAPQQNAAAPSMSPTTATVDEASMIELSNPAPRSHFTLWLSAWLLLCLVQLAIYAVAESKRSRSYAASRNS